MRVNAAVKSLLTVSAYKTDLPAMLSSNYNAATHNTTHSMHMHNTQPIPSPLPSITLLCTQLTNTKHSWQNGTKCRDSVNVSWCRSHLVQLVFEHSIPTCTCFPLENFFVTFIYLSITNRYFCDKHAPRRISTHYMWQSRVEIEHYSIAYFDRINVFKAHTCSKIPVISLCSTYDPYP